jgi:hypothetical protein
LSRHPLNPVVKPGDLLTIPLGDGRAYVGQVVDRTTRALYVVVFDHPVGANPTLDELAQAQTAAPLFATLTFDTRIGPEMWTAVGNSPAERDRFLPAFTYGAVETSGFWVTDYHDSRQRPATEDESKSIPRRKIRSPMVLEQALRAHEGLAPWIPAFEELRYRPTPTSRQLFGA